MSRFDPQLWLMAAAILALLVWYVVHIIQRTRQAGRALVALPGALEKAFDGSVPPWLRLIRILMIMLISFGAAWLVLRKFGISF